MSLSSTYPGASGLTDEHLLDLPGLASRWVRLPDGQRAHYVTAGDKGPAVVLLHGGIEGSSGTAGFRFMAPFLAANGFRVYCPDRPGYGLSDVSRPEYLDCSPKATVDFLKMFLDTLCIDQAHMSGNSLGCLDVANFMLSHPERVASAFFIAGYLGNVSPKPRVLPSQGRFSPNPGYTWKAWDGTPEGMHELMNGIIYQPKAIWPELVAMRTHAGLRQREARERFGVERNSRLEQQPGDQRQIYHSKDRIETLGIPMVYLYGLQDVLIPVEDGFNQEDVVPNVQFFYPDHCGHQGQTDRPELFNQVALELFRDGRLAWETAVDAGVSLRRPIDPRRVAEPVSGFPPPRPDIYTDIDTLRDKLPDALRGQG